MPDCDDYYSTFYYHPHLLANCLDPVKGSGHFILEAKIMPTFLLANENHSHPGCSTWNTLLRKKCKKSLTFRKFWRAGASAKVKYFFERSSKTFFSNWTKSCSLFWRGGASSRVTKLRMVCSAPIIQCRTWRVKSYLHEW